ncbi:hypothetical protein CMUS01_16492 [Colletotrichum musicola]|uniref:Uncharacterized protein n=1 Tax=Colletotrichum musicola TaxID=2175873 RepID=A0A8H6INF0_9PEZI|nr:hypothetical protein CMUS01_16492 [Colletotrichum musicola]
MDAVVMTRAVQSWKAVNGTEDLTVLDDGNIHQTTSPLETPKPALKVTRYHIVSQTTDNMKFTAVIVAAIALASGVAAKDCCCILFPRGNCGCVPGYENNVDCARICTVRGSSLC